MPKIKIMVIDDSLLMRRILNEILNKDPDIEVVASIGNVVYALNIIERVQPDLITLDIEMPEMDGLTALVEFRKKYPKLPIIMCSSLTLNGAEVTLEALNRGANDYITKPSSAGSIKDSFEQMGQELLFKVKGLTGHLLDTPHEVDDSNIVGMPKVAREVPRRIDMVAIGISTGGPNALTDLLPKIPRDFNVPIVIVQHMPAVFTKILADNLSKHSQIQIKEVEEGDIIVPGNAYIAPGNFHLTVVREGVHIKARLNQESPENYCRPAVDVLFRSLSKLYKDNMLAVVMTGMGQDGMLGCKEIKKNGGLVIIQDQDSSVVWGMPGAVYKEQLADSVYSLSNLDKAIVECVSKNGYLL